MARTYRSEGRNVVNLSRGLLVIASLSFYFYILESNNFFVLLTLLLLCMVAAELIGAVWTRNRRTKSKKKKEQKKASGKLLKKALTDQELLIAKVDDLSGTDFERLMEMYYIDKGYEVKRIGGSGDHEVDLILRDKKGYTIAVQCKRWKQDVGNDIVLRLKAGKQVHKCYDAWIVTTSHFTKSAQEAAKALNIRLINGAHTQDMIASWRKERLKKVR
ncbi:restriction endonuclease [Ammoniphilus sp. YIM 78166]|uniref:restriction endonuclease n=1 Tax=Ammoniphilus sp. YIM 78166 TaxID=1644106 RepID=UPI00106F32A0|nr:restriction endonuclease [Ammoniphilus sp. YIM 78166]